MKIEKNKDVKEEIKVSSNEKKQSQKRVGGGFALPALKEKKDA